MGWAFKAPRHDDIKQWRNVELLRRAGVMFDGDQNLPAFRTVQDAEAFLASRRERWEKENLARANSAKQEMRRRRTRSRQRAGERRARAQRTNPDAVE